MFPISRIILLLPIFIYFNQFLIVFTQPPKCTNNTIVPSRTGLLNLLNFNNVQSKKRLVVTILIEMLCPFSRKFMNEKWCPIYKDFISCMNMNFVVSGNTDKLGTPVSCQHGFKECAYNQDARNVISENMYSPNGQSIISCFICCIFGNDSKNTLYETCSQNCARQCGVNYISIKNLRNTTSSILRWYDSDSFTHSLSDYEGTPCIGYCNGPRFDASQSGSFQGDLRNKLCQLLGANSPCCRNRLPLGLNV